MERAGLHRRAHDILQPQFIKIDFSMADEAHMKGSIQAAQHPERIGKYKIVGELGRGAMGLVYRGHDPDLDRPGVEELGRRHTAYGVELRHYDAVEQALLETFRQLLGEHFTTDVRLAWSGVYNQIARIMIEAKD